MALRTPTRDAEDIKLRFGCALRELADPAARSGARRRGARPRQLSRQTLAEVIEPRVEELYSLIQAELRRSGFEELLSSGIVLTGGSSLMQGMVELGEEIFHMPVRVGMPELCRQAGRSGVQPALLHRGGAAAVGAGPAQHEQMVQMHSASFRQVFERMRTWFQGNF